MTAPVSVVVVTHNSGEVLGSCLDSVAAQTHRRVEVVVVDNGSGDRTVEIARTHPASPRVVSNSSNLGFAAANNQGIRESFGEFVVLLNDDARLDPGMIAACVSRIDRRPAERIGSISPKIYKDRERRILDSTGIVVNKTRIRPFDRGEGEQDLGQYDRPEWIFGATAAAGFYRRGMLEETSIDGEVLDEDYFAYYEDVDLAWRAQVMGWKCLYLPEAAAVHPRRGPFEKPAAVRKHFLVNRYFCYVKNEPLRIAASYLPYMIPYEAARLARLFLTQPGAVAAIPLFFRLLPRMWYKRHSVLGRRAAPYSYLRQFR